MKLSNKLQSVQDQDKQIMPEINVTGVLIL